MGSKTESLSFTSLFTDPRLLTITLCSTTVTFATHAATPALPKIVADLGATEQSVGLIISFFVLPGILVLPILVVLADIYGRRLILIPSLLLYGVAGTAIAFVDTFNAILALRIVQGIGGAAIMTVAITVIGDIYTGPAGAAAQGIRNGANGLSAIVVPAAAGFLAGIAWNYPFFMYIIPLPAAVLTYLFIPETLDTSGSRPSIKREIGGYISAIKEEMTTADTSVLVWGGFFQGFSYYAILTFVPLFAVQGLQTSVFLAGAVLSARGIIRIPLSPASGWLLTIMSRKTALVITTVISAIGTGLMGLSPDIVVLFLMMGLFGVGDALFTPIHRVAVTDHASVDQRAGVVGIMLTLRRVGAGSAPVVLGFLLVVIGYQGLFIIAASFYAVYAVILLLYFSSEG